MGSRILGLVLMSAVLPVIGRFLPSPSPEELVRRGNTAYERGEFDQAVQAYQKAEQRTTDPGLVAFNKAAALYQLGRYREAELHYRCCLEDAMGHRRAGALYGLGNALLQQSPERGAEVLPEAIRRYEECLRQEEHAVAADARHNLELAKLLLARLPSPPSDHPDHQTNGSEDRPPMPDPPQGQNPGPTETGFGTPDSRADQQSVKRAADQDAIPTDQSPGGSGSRPPVPDREELVPLSREDAEEHLKDAAERILKARQRHKQNAAQGVIRSILDW